MPPLLALLLLPLASCQLVETLRHGSIFWWLRDAAARAERTTGTTRALTLPLRSLNCTFCFSHWAAAICVVLVFCGDPGLVVLAWLFTVRASNIINDFTKRWSRTPGARTAPEILQEVSTEHLEEEFIRRTSHPFGVPPSAVPAPGSQESRGSTP